MSTQVSQSLDRTDQLIGLLDFEIRRIEADNTRPGWNVWALLGAAGTTVWLALKELEFQHVDISKSLLIIVGLQLSSNLIFLLTSSLERSDRYPTDEVRIRFTKSLLGTTRTFVVLKLLQYGSLGVIVLMDPVIPRQFLTYCVVAYFGLCTLVLAHFLLLSFSEIPLPEAPRNLPRILKFILWVVVPAFVVAVVRWLWSASHYFSLADLATVRFASLSWVAIVLTLMLARQRVRPPLLTTLIDLRRQLGLNEIDYDTARSQTEMALRGLRVSDIFQEQARRFLEYMREVVREQETIRSNVQALGAAIGEPSSANFGEHERTVTAALSESIHASFERAENSMANSERELDTLVKRLERIRVFAPYASSDIAEFVRQLQASWDDLREKSAQITSATAEATKALSDRVRRSQSDIEELLGTENSDSTENFRALPVRNPDVPPVS